MRYLCIFAVVILSSCTTIDSELKAAVAFGEIKVLNEYSQEIDKSLFVRLYRSPVYKENCFRETHGVCQYQYYMSVSTFDEYPETAIFKILEQGEIKEVHWSNSSEVDTAIIDLTMNSFTGMALKNNPSLNPDAKRLRIKVSPLDIEQSLLE